MIFLELGEQLQGFTTHFVAVVFLRVCATEAVYDATFMPSQEDVLTSWPRKFATSLLVGPLSMCSSITVLNDMNIATSSSVRPKSSSYLSHSGIFLSYRHAIPLSVSGLRSLPLEGEERTSLLSRHLAASTIQ